MFNIKWISVKTGIIYYYADDFFVSKSAMVRMGAQWGGTLAPALGLDSTKFLRSQYIKSMSRQFNDLKWKQSPRAARSGFDCVLTPPKSVSIQALVAGDNRIIEIHDRAVIRVMKIVGKHVKYRITIDKKPLTLAAPGIAYVSFRHTTSRELDPNIHTHAIVLNATIGPDGVLRSITNDEVLYFQKRIDFAYKHIIAQELRKIGYSIVSGNMGFEIAGYDRNVIELFSKRLFAVENDLVGRGHDLKSADAAMIHLAVLTSRPEKTQIDRLKLVRGWKKELADVGYTLPRIPSPGQSIEENGISAREAVSRVIREFSTLHYVITNARDEIIPAAMCLGGFSARVTIDKLDAALDHAIANGDVIMGYNGRSLLTKRSVVPEARILSLFEEGFGAVMPAVSSDDECDSEIFQTEARIGTREMNLHLNRTGQSEKVLNYDEREIWRDQARLTPSQHNLVSKICLGIDAVMIVGVHLGTMVASAMEVLQSVMKTNGIKMIGLGETARHVDSLNSASIKSRLTRKTLDNPTFWNSLNEKTVLVVDGVESLGVREIDTIITNVRLADARVIFLGYCPALAMAESLAKSTGSYIYLNDDRVVPGSVAAQQRDQRRVVVVASREQRIKKIASIYVHMTVTKKQPAVIVTASHADRLAINAAVRQERGFAASSDGQHVISFASYNASRLDLMLIRTYSVGDLIRYKVRSKNGRYPQGADLRVIEKRSDRLIVETSAGVQCDFIPARESDNLELGLVETIHLSSGDLVQLNTEKGAVYYSMPGTIGVRLNGSGKEFDVDVSGARPVSLRHAYCEIDRGPDSVEETFVIKHESYGAGRSLKSPWYSTSATEKMVFVIADVLAGKELELMKIAPSRKPAPFNGSDLVRRNLSQLSETDAVDEIDVFKSTYF